MDKKNALLVIDMQNVYLQNNKWACENIEKSIPYIIDLIKHFPKNQIFFTCFISSNNPKGVWNDYNIMNKDVNDNKYLNEYITEIKPYITKDNSFSKSTYSSCKNEILYKKLDEFENIYVVGVVAECCVLSTIFDLIDMGKKVIYCKNGISGITAEQKNLTIKILENLSPLHVIFQ